MKFVSRLLFLLVFAAGPLAWGQAPLPEKLESELQESGWFQEGEDDFGLKASIETIVQSLKKPTDPQFRVIISKSSEVNAFSYQEEAGIAYIVLNMGLIQSAESADELVFVTGHELAHSQKFGRRFNSQLEEIETADRGGMERMLNAGFDPRSSTGFLVRLPVVRSHNGLLHGSLNTHPNVELRVTAANVWLKENFNRFSFPEPRPLELSESAKLFKASLREKPEKPGRRDVVKLFELAQQHSGFQNLPPYIRLVFLLGSFKNDRSYYDLLLSFLEGKRSTLDDRTLKEVSKISRESESVETPHEIYKLILSAARQIEAGTLTVDQANFVDELIGRDRPRLKDDQIASKMDVWRPIEAAILVAGPHSYKFNNLYYLRLVEQTEFLRASRDINAALESYGWILSSHLEREGGINFPALVERSWFASRRRQLLLDGLADPSVDMYRVSSLWDRLPFLVRLQIVRSILTSSRFPLGRLYRLWVAMPSYRDKLARKLLKIKILSMLRSTSDLFSSDILEARSYENLLELIESKTWEIDWQTAEKIVSVDLAWHRYSITKSDIFRGNLPDYSGPAYSYDDKYASNLQRWMEQGLVRSGDLKPFSTKLNSEQFERWYRFWELLTSRAVTSYTDQLALRLFSPENLKQKPELLSRIQRVLEQQRVWDFALRRDLILIQVQKSWDAVEQDPRKRRGWLHEQMATLDLYFPEKTFERQLLLEELANRARTNPLETKMIERAKTKGSAQPNEIGLRLFSGFYEHVFTADRESASQKNTAPGTQVFAALKFLIEGGPAPDFLVDILIEVGEQRFRRMFQTLTPEIRALVLSPLLEKPRGLLRSKEWEEKIMDLILAKVTAHEETSRLFLRAVIHALETEAPFEKPLVLAFMLSMRVNSGNRPVPIGVIVRQCLEAMGNSGVSLGQKIRQRQLAPQEILIHLDDLQDRTRVPSRYAIFEMIKYHIPNAESMLEKGELQLVDIKGAASTKIVVTVQYKNGQTQSFDSEEILKLLRDNFDRTTEVEIRKLRAIQGYLETHGSPQYRRFRSVIDLIERNLRQQNNLAQDLRNYETVRDLYANSGGDSEFRFEVISPLRHRGIETRYAHENLANGQSLKSLSAEEQIPVYAAIYKKEAAILLHDLDGLAALIFEADRHRGNYIVDLRNKIIYIFDYALLSKISAEERRAVLETIGYLYFHLSSRGPVASTLPSWIPGLLTRPLDSALRSRVGSREKAFSRIGTVFDGVTSETWNAYWKKAGPLLDKRLHSDDKVFEVFQDLLALGEESGLTLKAHVNDFIFALSHLEFYSRFAPTVNRLNPLTDKIRDHMVVRIRSDLMETKPRSGNPGPGRTLQRAVGLSCRSVVAPPPQ